MTIRAREAVAAEFLRRALGGDAVGVPQLDMMARAAGLLGERQRITDAKVFRRAKSSLGIRSIRDGFGAGGGWSWELPRSSEGRAPTPSEMGPQATGNERGVPREWVDTDHPLTFRAIVGASSSMIAKPSSLLNNWPAAPLS